MSDHVDPEGYSISSCHSQGDSYFRCAQEEAKSGGAVAYAVNNEELMKVNLQEDEIFADKERKVKGIHPIERLRLRRFTSQTDELLVPEVRTYPAKTNNFKIKSVPGFRDAVVSWAKEVQKNIIEEIKKDPQAAFKQFNLRGGHYQDNQAGEIWSKFLGVNLQGSKRSLDQSGGDKQGMDALEWEDQARYQLRQHERNWKNTINVSFEAFDNAHGDAYGNWHSEINFEFDLDNFVRVPENNKELKELIPFLVNVRKHYDEIKKVSITKGTSFLDVTLRFNQEEGTSSLEEFEAFLDEMDNIDETYQEIKEDVIDFFKHKEFMKNEITSTHGKYKWNHFTLEVPKNYAHGDTDYYVVSSEMEMGDLSGLPLDDNVVQSSGFNSIDLNWTDIIFHHQLYLPLPVFVNFDSINRNVFFKTNVSSLNSRLVSKTKPFGPEDKISFLFQFSINFKDMPKAKKVLAGCQYLDKNWESVAHNMRNWWQKVKDLVATNPDYPYRYGFRPRS